MEIYVDTSTQTKAKNRLLSGVLGWVFIGLLITIVSAYAVAFGLIAGLKSNGLVSIDQIVSAYQWLMILSLVVHLVLTITMNVMFVRNKSDKNLVVPYIIYTANFGIMLSPYVLVTDAATLGIGLGIALLLFGVMYLVARYTKANLRPMGMIGGSLFMGLFLISLIVMFIPDTTTLSWILSLGSFAAIMMITMYDLWIVVKADQHVPAEAATKNLKIGLALRIYIDFIYILIRIIQFIAVAKNRN